MPLDFLDVILRRSGVQQLSDGLTVDNLGFAPLYDLLCTVAYPEVHAKFAMKVGGRATLDAVETIIEDNNPRGRAWAQEMIRRNM